MMMRRVHKEAAAAAVVGSASVGGTGLCRRRCSCRLAQVRCLCVHRGLARLACALALHGYSLSGVAGRRRGQVRDVPWPSWAASTCSSASSGRMPAPGEPSCRRLLRCEPRLGGQGWLYAFGAVRCGAVRCSRRRHAVAVLLIRLLAAAGLCYALHGGIAWLPSWLPGQPASNHQPVFQDTRLRWKPLRQGPCVLALPCSGASCSPCWMSCSPMWTTRWCCLRQRRVPAAALAAPLAI